VVVGMDSTLIRYGKAHSEHISLMIKEAGGIKKLHSQHQLMYSNLKLMFATGKTAEAMNRLEKLCDGERAKRANLV